MSYTWTTVSRPGADDDVRDIHTLWCLIWHSPDPTDACDCGADDIAAGCNTRDDTDGHGRV